MSHALEKLAQAVGEALKKQHYKLATAESCTGGGLSYWVTSIPGSSDWFERGFVTYSNQAKIEMLNVPATLLATHGAVSEETARAMAKGALEKSTADFSIAITGIAGPSGGSKEKPVGTVWIAWAKRKTNDDAQMEIFSGNRQEVRIQIIEKALKRLLQLV